MKTIKLILLLFLLASVTGGCAKCMDCGQMRHSVEVKKSVTSATIIPEYNYYTYWEGGFAPLAILGLEKQFTIKSSFWKPTVLEQSEFRRWSTEYNTAWGQYDDMKKINMKYKGYVVSDPSGQQVGIYYSVYEWMIFKFLPDNVIQVSRPQPSSRQLITTRGRDN